MHDVTKGKNIVERTDEIDMHDLIERSMMHLWAVVNDLAKVHPKAGEHYRVTIFGSARIEEGDPVYEEVKKLAAELSELGCDIVTGGGPGLMQAANAGSQLGDPDDKRKSIGIRVELPFEQGANPFVEEVYNHHTFFSRLHQFVRLSDAYVVVGGGVGTTLELFLIWQLLQVKHLPELPLVLVGPMWASLIDWAKKHLLEGETPFISPKDIEIPVCVSRPSDVVAVLKPFIERHRACSQDE